MESSGQLHLQRENYRQLAKAFQDSADAYGEQTPPQVHYLMAIVALNLEDFETANAALFRIENTMEYAKRVEQLKDYILQLQARKG